MGFYGTSAHKGYIAPKYVCVECNGVWVSMFGGFLPPCTLAMVFGCRCLVGFYHLALSSSGRILSSPRPTGGCYL